jgi:GTPase
VIHCEIVRQAARVVAMDRERLRSGDRKHFCTAYFFTCPAVMRNERSSSIADAHIAAGACVRFRFLQRPEYLTPGTRFVFREGRTKGIGMVMAT